MFRMVGLIVTLAILGMMFMWMNASAEKGINTNPAVIERKATLQQATGIDPNDKKALRDYTLKQAKEIEDYQSQLNTLPNGE